MQKYNVINIPIADMNIPKFVELIRNNINQFNNVCVSATGAHGIISATKNELLYNILNSFEFNLPDGQPAVWIVKMKGAKKTERCFGPYVFKEIIKSTANTNIKHYFCGGKKGVAEDLVISCKKKFNNNNIVGTFSPPFREIDKSEIKELANDINIKGTDILWIGISTPKQEILAKRLSKYTNVKMILTVGAAFDYYTGSIKIAPTWVQNMGLEWFFRLCLEPFRLWKRYLEIVPKFIIYVILDLMKIYKHPFEKKGS